MTNVEEEAKIFLHKIAERRVRCEILKEKARFIRESLYAPATARTDAAGGAARRGGWNADPLGDGVARLAELEARVAAEEHVFRQVECALAALEDDERRVAELYFLQARRGNVKLLAAELCCDRTTVTRIAARAAGKIGAMLQLDPELRLGSGPLSDPE